MVDQIRVDVRPSAAVCWLINTIKLGICVCQCVCVCVCVCAASNKKERAREQ